MEDSEARGEGLTSDRESEEGAGHEGRGREAAWPLLDMGSQEPVRDRHPSAQGP